MVAVYLPALIAESPPAKFAVEKLTERLEGVICPLPRCSEAILDVPPVAQQKCVRCPYCTKFFCQKCKIEAEVLGMTGDMVLAKGGGDADEEDVDGDEVRICRNIDWQATLRVHKSLSLYFGCTFKK